MLPLYNSSYCSLHWGFPFLLCSGGGYKDIFPQSFGTLNISKPISEYVWSLGSTSNPQNPRFVEMVAISSHRLEKIRLHLLSRYISLSFQEIWIKLKTFPGLSHLVLLGSPQCLHFEEECHLYLFLCCPKPVAWPVTNMLPLFMCLWRRILSQ